MVQVQQRLLNIAAATALAGAFLTAQSAAVRSSRGADDAPPSSGVSRTASESRTGGVRFYPDDPLWVTPPPLDVTAAQRRKLSEYFDFFMYTLFHPAEQHRDRSVYPSLGVNTVDEVPDSSWYTNRHGRRRMSIDELRRGPGNTTPPSRERPWTVVAAKTEGITPGFTIEDPRGNRYLLKFDPKQYPEIASGADVVVSKFFYAFGYFVPENYIVTFTADNLRVGDKARFIDQYGRERNLAQKDVDAILTHVPQTTSGEYRALASRFIAGKLLGPFRFHGTRTDDPNDIYPHEHRRDLRGMHVFSAWMGHNDVKSLNSLDSLIEENGRQHIRHYLIDFGAALGSDSWTIKTPRAGNEYLFAWRPAALQLFSLGLFAKPWMLANYPEIRGVGRFECEVFDPELWLPNYPIPAFQNRLPDDNFWAAKQVMRFTDEEIHAIVETGEYSDPAATDYISRCLQMRRDKIGRTYFTRVLPLDNFAIADGKLTFSDLGVTYKIHAAQSYTIDWFRHDNNSGGSTPVAGNGAAVPDGLLQQGSNSYFGATIRGSDPRKVVALHFRNVASGVELVGVERKW